MKSVAQIQCVDKTFWEIIRFLFLKQVYFKLCKQMHPFFLKLLNQRLYVKYFMGCSIKFVFTASELIFLDRGNQLQLACCKKIIILLAIVLGFNKKNPKNKNNKPQNPHSFSKLEKSRGKTQRGVCTFIIRLSRSLLYLLHLVAEIMRPNWF